MNVEILRESTAYKVEIFIGCDDDDFEVAQLACEDYCTDVGLCVTVTPTIYCYRNGRCMGLIVGLINYARFPKPHVEIWQQAVDLAYVLKRRLGQGSFTVQDGTRSVFVSTRDEDQLK